MAGNKALTLSIRIAGKMDKSLTAVVNGAQSQITSLSKGLSKAGTIGLASMGAIATGAVATIARCTKEAEQFANGMGDVVKYVSGLADADGKISSQLAYNGRAYAQNYAEISKAIRDLSTQIPYTQAELQQLAASAGQSGKSITDLYKYDSRGQLSGFLRDVAMMGTAWDIEASQAGDWAAKWEVALGKNHDQIMTLADQINYLGANNATTAAEIGDVVNRVASFGQVAGMQAEDTAALATSLLAMGVEGAKAASSISRMYTNLNKGASATKAQKEMWESMGMTATGVAKGMQKDATGTLISVFNAVKQLPDEKRVAALSTLFGQWAIEGGGKLTTNLEAFTGALKSIQDPKNYEGSMARELAIKMGTPEAVSQMLSSSVSALKGEIGESFLPVKKEFSLAMIDAVNGMRQHMPEISRLADTLAGSLSSGVGKISDAVQAGMPVFLRGLDYVANNGPKVVSILEKLVAVLAAMKFAPGIESLLGGVGGAVLGKKQIKGGRKGGLLGLFRGGQNAAGMTGNVFSNITGGIRSATAGVNGGIRGMFANGAVGALATIQNMKGLLSGNAEAARSAIDKTIMDARLNGAGGVLKNMLSQTRIGRTGGKISQYFGNIAASFGNLRNTQAGGGIAAFGGATKEILSNISQATGLTGLINGVSGAAKSGAGWVAGKAGSALSAAAGSTPIQMVKGMAGSVGSFAAPIFDGAKQFAGAGLGALGSVWGPMAGGFGSLFAGAAPVVAAISGVIAVVSILGDHLEDIRGIVGSVFGDEGVAIFDSFTGKLSTVGDFISGLFKDGGVANALAPLQQGITNMFGDGAGAAFGGVIQILQSVMGVISQIVAFSTGTVKPIIQDVFSFITGTVMPIILQTFTAAAPTISSIISNIGSAVMTGMQMIGTAIQFVMPFIKGLITTFLSIASVVIPAVLTGIQVFTAGIYGVIGSVQGIFQGLINFITGVFTGNWGQAWEGVKQIFGNAFNALTELVKTPINAVISMINSAISAINGLSVSIPEWVPVAGGKQFSPNLPTIPMLAKGGFTKGASIAGEAGTEAVISFQRGVRNRNIDTWMRAGQMLGIGSKLKEISMDGITGPIEFQFAPVLNIQGNADVETINRVLSDKMKEFEAMCEAWWERKMRQQARRSY